MIFTKVIISATLLLFAAIADADPLIFVGRLVEIRGPRLDCGRYWITNLAVYENVKTISGDFRDGLIFVVHDCIEIPRSKFSPTAGTLVRFEIGDTHRLEVNLVNTADRKYGYYKKIAEERPVYHASRVDKYIDSNRSEVQSGS